ncbi:DUF6078 family protein [Bacteroides sp. 51]|uniref:DUF6078 family protein n=1 Tax=Bacteroides sp. 51 TaxID=2302938 RepID=UPI0013D3CE8F|nr:DUF6078 family protein [Bacteroides sp. 51]NDV83762.1 hypothetical protein [Bacteroides sp. 51]
MKKETYNNLNVPHGLSLCVSGDCSHATTCLRQIAYENLPASTTSLLLLNPKMIMSMTKKCKYYLSNEKIRYAKGFTCTTGSLPVRVSGVFRRRLINLWSIRRYYQKRKGETLLLPAEQQQVIALAKELGVHQNEYFDGYVEEYYWG